MKKSWKTKRLGEISEIKYGYTEKASHDSVGPKFLRITDIQNGHVEWKNVPYCKIHENEFRKYELHHNDIVFARTGATTGKSFLLKEPPSAIFASYLIRSKILDFENSLPEFLFYFFQTHSYWRIIQMGLVGSAQGGFNASKLSKIEISLPLLQEQRRIVAILDDAFSAIDKAKGNVEKNIRYANNIFDGFLKTIFENNSSNWKIKILGEVCSLYQGIAINAKTKHALVEKSNLPLLRIKDLKNNTVEQYIDPSNYPKNALVNETDIIYTRTGSLGLVFRGKKGVLHNNSFKVVPNSELTHDYLFIWLQNPIFKSKIMELALRAAQPDITHAIFKVQEIAIPSINEQEIIVKKLDELSIEIKKLESIYQKKLSLLDELKKSLLQKAFAGEL